jgi:hypothetical protein
VELSLAINTSDIRHPKFVEGRNLPADRRTLRINEFCYPYGDAELVLAGWLCIGQITKKRVFLRAVCLLAESARRGRRLTATP